MICGYEHVNAAHSPIRHVCDGDGCDEYGRVRVPNHHVHGHVRAAKPPNDILVSQPFTQWRLGQFEHDQHNDTCAKRDCKIVEMQRAKTEEIAH